MSPATLERGIRLCRSPNRRRVRRRAIDLPRRERHRASGQVAISHAAGLVHRRTEPTRHTLNAVIVAGTSGVYGGGLPRAAVVPLYRRRMADACDLGHA